MLDSHSAKLNHIHKSYEENPLFQSVLEISDEAVFIISRDDFKIIDCNTAARKLFETGEKTELVNLPVFKLYNFQPMDMGIERLKEELKAKGNYS